jgi:hypothetical protein
MAGGQSPSAQLPEDVGMYVDKLRRGCPAIDQIWLLGQHKTPAGDAFFDLLLFGDRASLSTLRADTTLQRADVKLVVVTDDDRFESVWGDPETGSLSESGWRLEGPTSARFHAPLAREPLDGSVSAVAARVR